VLGERLADRAYHERPQRLGPAGRLGEQGRVGERGEWAERADHDEQVLSALGVLDGGAGDALEVLREGGGLRFLGRLDRPRMLVEEALAGHGRGGAAPRRGQAARGDVRVEQRAALGDEHLLDARIDVDRALEQGEQEGVARPPAPGPRVELARISGRTEPVLRAQQVARGPCQRLRLDPLGMEALDQLALGVRVRAVEARRFQASRDALEVESLVGGAGVEEAGSTERLERRRELADLARERPVRAMCDCLPGGERGPARGVPECVAWAAEGCEGLGHQGPRARVVRCERDQRIEHGACLGQPAQVQRRVGEVGPGRDCARVQLEGAAEMLDRLGDATLGGHDHPEAIARSRASRVEAHRFGEAALREVECAVPVVLDRRGERVGERVGGRVGHRFRSPRGAPQILM
jgi:hypothetical protein